MQLARCPVIRAAVDCWRKGHGIDWYTSPWRVSQSETNIGIFVGIYVPKCPGRGRLIPVRSSQQVYFLASEPNKPF